MQLLSSVAVVMLKGVLTCALTTAGRVKCWGSNARGGLGAQTTQLCPVSILFPTPCSTTPLDVTGLDSGISAGTPGCVVTATGSVKCWGINHVGQVGDGSTTDRPAPVDVCADPLCVATLSGAAAIARGGLHTCALTTAGSVKCWGYNRYGQLGDGTIIDRRTPVDVEGLAP